MSRTTSTVDLHQRVEALEKDLHLKQLQINRLLNMTQAINNNIKFEDLFRMYQSFLSWEMGITRMALYVRDKEESAWICPVFIGLQPSFVEKDGRISHLLPQFARLTNLRDSEHPFLREFDLVIPVMHKDQPIAYTLLGNMDQDDQLYSKVQFITTITNVVAVALENKRLFKRQLEQERLKREMELASDIQMMLVPALLPESELYEVASIYRPQLGVGGDYFDFIQQGKQRLSFCVADISGKGLAAAMIMSNFQASLHSLLIQQLPIDELIHRLNHVVYCITQGSRFITFFYAEFDVATRILRYINAGHVPSLLVREGDLKSLESGCTILGSFPQLPSLEIGEENIPPDAMILNYTDGLTDLKNDDGDFLNEQLLFDFTRLHHHLSPKEFNRQLMDRMELFRGQQPFPDDVTVLTCRFR
jgi:phosphoserine phosphatase RsbU/P